MKKLVFFATSFSLIFAITTPIVSMDCCLRFICCTGTKTREPVQPARDNHRLEAIHRALIDTQKTMPAALRELYLKYQLPDYTFSREVQDYLEGYAFIDHEGTINPRDHVLIASCLQPGESCLRTDDWYLLQRVIDFSRRYPTQAQELRSIGIKLKTPVSSDTLGLLRSYMLIASIDRISLEEKRHIIGLIPAFGEKLENFTIAAITQSTRPPIRAPYGDTTAVLQGPILDNPSQPKYR